MRKSYKLLFIVLLFIGIQSEAIIAQDWFSKNGNPTVSQLNEVQYVTDQIVYAVGNNGTIIKSTDSGETWDDISYGTTRDLRSLFFFDENTGFVGGPFGTALGGSSEMLAKTTDGGETWDVRSDINFNNFNDIEFINEQTGWVASADGDVLYTTDSGENWSSFTAGSEDLLDLTIINDTTLWVAGEQGSLYKTTNGGTTWESAIDVDTISVSEFETLNPFNELYSVEFSTDSLGYVVGKKYSSEYNAFVAVLLKTDDAGESWAVVDHNFQHLIYDIETGTNGEVVLAGGTEFYSDTESESGNVIYISEDEGNTWKVISEGSGTLFWDDIDVLNGNWIAGGESGTTTSFALANDTLSSSLLTGYDIDDITFFNNSTGAFVTSERLNGKVFITTDGGENWTESYSLEGRKDFTSVAFADENNIWAVGNDHFTGGSVWLIYHSSDQGENWTKVELDYPEFEKDQLTEKIQFLDSENGFLKIDEKFLKTNNGGSTWTEFSEPNSFSFDDFFSFHFLDNQYGWLAGKSKIAVTTDGGSSWNLVYEDDDSRKDITNVQFLNNNDGYATMEEGDLLKTEDGGNTWEDIIGSSRFDLNNLFFTSADSGYAVGEIGLILTTSDGGENFDFNFSATKKDLFTIHFLDDRSIGWIGGENGTFLSTTNGGGIATSIDDPSTPEIPSSVKFSQNYPNPFNPSTTISYQITNSNLVTLKVYDLLGREVATLVDTHKAAGEHTVTLNAENLASGIYIYRLRAGNSVITKKLTLIK